MLLFPHKCFTSKDAIMDAVNACFRQVNTYVNHGAVCAAAKQKYGWPVNVWCFDGITDMSGLLAYTRNFNEDISGWNTASVTNMEKMFDRANSFNQDISKWNTGRVANMNFMFYYALSFNQNLCAWGDKFPYGNSRSMFGHSGCSHYDSTVAGPQCASYCNVSIVCVSYVLF